MLVVSATSVATSPTIMANLPRLRLYDLLGCSVGVRDMLIVLCLRGSLIVSLVCLLLHFVPEYHNVQESSGWTFVRHSGSVAWRMLLVIIISVIISCLWWCILAMVLIADSASVKMTMLFTHGGLGLSQSFEMLCKTERIAFSSSS